MEKIGIGESSDIKQGSDDDKLQFNDTPELRGRLAGHLRGYYPSLVMNILYGDLNKVNEEIKYYLSKIESRIQEHDEFMEGVIFVADVKIVGREEMCKWKNFVERMIDTRLSKRAASTSSRRTEKCNYNYNQQTYSDCKGDNQS